MSLRKICLAAMVSAAALIVSPVAWAAETAAPGTAFDQSVKPFLKRNCALCHNAKTASGGLNLNSLASEDEALKDPALWEKVRDRMAAGDMPPKQMPRPNADQQQTVVSWIEASLKKIDAMQTPEPGRVTARRLNRAEYNNTVRDLFGIRLRPADDFPGDDSGYGFDNNGDVLTLSPVLMDRYLTAASKVVHAALVLPEKPLVASRERISLDGGSTTRRPREAETTLDLPVPAMYKLVARIKDNRRDLREAGQVSVWFDGKPIGTQTIKGARFSDDQVTEYEFRVDAEPGLHRVKIELFNEDGEALQLRDPRNDHLTQALSSLDLIGPFNQRPKPINETHKRVFTCSESAANCAFTILNDVASRAFRRPATKDELSRLVALQRKTRQQGATFEESVGVAIQAILVSPNFLFRIEKDTGDVDADGTRRLTGYELASRLSYFLWSSMPDAELFRLAASGELLKPEVQKAQTARMLADTKARALVDNFAGQWLQLRNLRTHEPDREQFPGFDQELRQSMMTETQMFLEDVMRQDRSIVELINGRYTFLNERLARFYGIDGVYGDQFRRVNLRDPRRGGILTQASILTISSYPARTSPVIRGVWVLNNILGTPPPPPPPNVPELEATKSNKELTLREKLELHRGNAVCAACHAKFDPLGFGLENFDAVGQWRDKDGDAAIDSSGTLPDGRKFTGPAELKEILAQDRKMLARTMATKLLIYATGRGTERYDRPAIDQVVAEVESADYKFHALIEGVVASLPFQRRRVEVPDRPTGTAKVEANTR